MRNQAAKTWRNWKEKENFKMPFLPIFFEMRVANTSAPAAAAIWAVPMLPSNIDEVFKSPGNTYDTLMKTMIEVAKVHPESVSTVRLISIRKDLSFNVVSRDRKMGKCFFAAADCTVFLSLMKNTGAIPKRMNARPVKGPMIFVP